MGNSEMAPSVVISKFVSWRQPQFRQPLPYFLRLLVKEILGGLVAARVHALAQAAPRATFRARAAAPPV